MLAYPADVAVAIWDDVRKPVKGTLPLRREATLAADYLKKDDSI